MRSMHYVHKINLYMAGYICLSVHMIQLDNRWTDLDEIWYGRYTIGIYPKIVLFNLLHSIILTWRTNKLVR
jgi:hypothetical protein